MDSKRNFIQGLNKCRRGVSENEYLHSARDVCDWFQLYLHKKYIFPDKDIIETCQIHLLYCVDVHSHLYLFYIYQGKEYLLSSFPDPVWIIRPGYDMPWIMHHYINIGFVSATRECLME